MRKLLTVSLTLTILLVSCSVDREEVFDSVSKEVKSQFAPDRRDKTFDVKMECTDGRCVVHGSTTEPAAREALLSALSDKGLQVTDSIVLLPDPALGNETYAVVSHSVGNLRYGADYSSEMASQVLMGTPLKVLEKKGHWYRVVTPEGYIAWITSGSLRLMDEAEFLQWKQSDRLVLTRHYTLFRNGTAPQAQIVSDGVMGDIVQLNGRKTAGHYPVRLANGTEAFIPEGDAVPLKEWLATRSASAANIIATARMFLGFPYLWAGTSPKAMDCSGFTKTVFFLNGVILRRDASQQARTGKDIPIQEGIGNLQPGDLLFFGSKADGSRPERVTHVGIYIGEGEFIHSATSVHISSLVAGRENYYEGSKRLVRARRLIGQEDKEKGITTLAQHPWYSMD